MKVSKEYILNLSVLGILTSENQNQKLKYARRYWSKSMYLKRDIYSHINLLEEIRFHPPDWHNYLRMDEPTYLELLSLVTPLIQKQDTCMRKAITPHERLTATLRVLVTGRTYECMKFSAIISPQALGQIVPETCDAIIKVLKQEYLKFPSSAAEWKKIAHEFEVRWNFPSCCGAVDGKHVAIVPPPGSGSYFYNYKLYHSMVLMGIANANYEFVYVHFGINGRNSDGGVLRYTDFYEKLVAKDLMLPSEKPTPNSPNLPYVFIGDEAFMLREDFLKPFSSSVLNKERRIFNYRLSRARRIIENVFGILAARFRIFQGPIHLKLENIERVVMACCALHNFLRRKSTSYTTAECFDYEDIESGDRRIGLETHDQMVSVSAGYDRHSSARAVHVRDKFSNYFNNEGRVNWQDRFA